MNADFRLPATRYPLSAFRHPPIVNLESKIENPLCLSKYISVFVWSHTDLCRDPRRHARRHLNLSMYLCLYLYLYLMPHAALFERPFRKSFQKPFESSFDSSIGFK